MEIETNEQSLNTLLEKRWSPRAFSEEPISKEDVRKIFEAGRQVPSSYNEQPWSFIITIKGSEAYNKLYESLTEFNQSWVDTAPYLGAVVAKQHFTNQDKENRHAAYDCGAFMAAATLQATALNVFVHQMAGFSPEKIKQNFSLPKDQEAITAFVFGKIGDVEQLTDELQEKEDRESNRKALDKFLFLDEWGKSL